MNKLNDQLEDFASIPVPNNIRYSGLSIAMVTAVMVFGASSLSLGAQIGLSLGLRDSMIAFLLGGFFLSILAYIVGVIGVRSRLSSYVLIKIIFGKNGAILLNISLAIALLGWYGVSMDIFSASLNQLMRSILDINIPNYLIEITGGFLMTYSAIKGFKLLESLSTWITPLLIILTASLGYKAFVIWGQGLSQEILSAKPMTISMAADAVIGFALRISWLRPCPQITKAL
jgi:cytosine permease